MVMPLLLLKGHIVEHNIPGTLLSVWPVYILFIPLTMFTVTNCVVAPVVTVILWLLL